MKETHKVITTKENDIEKRNAIVELNANDDKVDPVIPHNQDQSLFFVHNSSSNIYPFVGQLENFLQRQQYNCGDKCKI